jgi:transglutaminase-like putative cysteine protease
MTEMSGSLRRVPAEPALATLGLLALTWSYASVLWHVTDVVGGRTAFVGVVIASLALAALVGRYVDVRVAFVLTIGLLILGSVAYLATLPRSQLELLTGERILKDTIALLTGLSILRLVGAGIWAIAVVPGPVFLSWYLAIRRRYVAAAAAGSVALGLVVLTGDASGTTTIVGVAGATTAVAADTFDRHGAGTTQVDVLTALVAAMVVFSATLSVVPGAAGSPILPNRGSPTVEGSIVDAQDRVEIVGSIRLSPKVRFTIESPQSDYWRTAVYDRYTSDGWVRTGNTRPYDGQLRGPPGPADRLEQVVTAEDEVAVLPAAAEPVRLDGEVTDRTVVTPQGTIKPTTTLEAGDTYTVTSRVPNATSDRLRAAGTDYPSQVTDQYLQLPDSTTDRVRERAESVAGDEITPYDKAVAIEEYLESEKEYSLSVPAPSGDIADQFLFEMDAGYCTYYATTMVVMLRSQGIPARFVTGYTAGEQVGNDSYVVRGLDSHAWVEVYFPDVGWVRFDPTPGGPRQTAESARLTEARQSGEENVDLTTSNATAAPVPDGNSGTEIAPSPTTESSSPAGNQSAVNGTLGPAQNPEMGVVTSMGTEDSGPLPGLPSWRALSVGFVGLLGIAAGAHRTGKLTRMRQLLAIQRQRRSGDPDIDVSRAHRRLSVLLEREYRARDPGETPRAYHQSLVDAGLLVEDSRRRDARRLLELYERAQYGPGVTPVEADEAVTTADRLVRSATPILRRFG